MFGSPMFPNNILNQPERNPPTGPFVLRPEAPPRLIPAKREDDEVQFVSENPVKKRKLNSTEAARMPAPPRPSNVTTTPTRAAAVASDDTKTAFQPGRSSDVGDFDSQMPLAPVEWDPMRGCSVPVFEKSSCLDDLWTAPATGLRPSPALSPKQLPRSISPALMPATSGQELGVILKSENPTSVGGLETQPIATDATSAVSPSTLAAHPEAASDAVMSTAAKSTDDLSIGTLEESSGRQQENARREAELRQETPQQLSGLPARVVQQTSPARNNTTSDQLSHPPRVHHSSPPESKPSLLDDLFNSDLSGPANLRDLGDLVNNDNQASIPVPPKSSIPSLAATSTHNFNAAEGCNNGLKAKGPCRQCLEERLRRQAAAMSAAGVNPMSGSSLSNPAQTPHPYPTLMQSAWTPSLNLAPYSNGYLPTASYGQLFPQPYAGGQMGPTSMQHALIPGSVSPNQTMCMAPQSPSTSSKAPKLAASQPKVPVPSAKSKATTSKQPPTYTSQTPTSGKHVIVDIADTCLDIFPFEAVAKRHHQPVQKIRDVFNAIIQVPLLRCPTDKRRAGKLGTARVKEYTQAKKDIPLGTGDVVNRQQGSQLGQGQQQPSVWDIAQFMGSSDVRLGAHLNFGGPW